VHAHPLSLHLPSPVKLQCTLQLSGQTHHPCFISRKICTLWWPLLKGVTRELKVHRGITQLEQFIISVFGSFYCKCLLNDYNYLFENVWETILCNCYLLW
jgi:hypothetical protein